VRLSIQGYKDQLMQHPTLIFNIESGVVVFYKMIEDSGIMWGPWLTTEKPVEAVFVLPDGKKIYALEDDIYTKLVSELGEAKYYTGPLTAFRAENWSLYSDAGQNYKIKKITKFQPF
jgi:hypothetical protein